MHRGHLEVISPVLKTRKDLVFLAQQSLKVLSLYQQTLETLSDMELKVIFLATQYTPFLQCLYP